MHSNGGRSGWSGRRQKKGAWSYLNEDPKASTTNWRAPVIVHVYNIVSLVRYLPFPLFHLGVEVHGREYCFGSDGITCCLPKKFRGYNSMKHREAIDIGRTAMAISDVEDTVTFLWKEFSPGSYNLISKNCQTFAITFCSLLGCSIPAEYCKFANGLPSVSDLMASGKDGSHADRPLDIAADVAYDAKAWFLAAGCSACCQAEAQWDTSCIIDVDGVPAVQQTNEVPPPAGITEMQRYEALTKAAPISSGAYSASPDPAETDKSKQMHIDESQQMPRIVSLGEYSAMRCSQSALHEHDTAAAMASMSPTKTRRAFRI